MIVCHCFGVSDRAIRKHLRKGATSAADIARATGAGTGCGGCVPALKEAVHRELRVARPAAHGLLIFQPATDAS